MKSTIGKFFEPLLFLVFLLSTGLMALSPARRRHYRLERSKAHTACSLFKAIRYTSKKVVMEAPFFLPGFLMIGALPGWFMNGVSGVLVGVSTVLGFLAMLPVVAPVPSVAAELDAFSK